MDMHGSDYLTLLDRTPLAIIVSDENDQIVFANESAKDAYGFDLQASQSLSIKKLHAKHQHKWNDIKEKTKRKGAFAFESVLKKLSGAVIDVWIKCESIVFNGKPAITTVIRDISDQQIIIREHFKERQFRQLILDAIPALIFVKDAENRLISMNRAYQETTGLNAETYLGKKIGEIMTDKDLADQYWQDDLEVIQTGLPKRNIVEPLLNDPNRWFITDKVPYKTVDGEIIGVIGFSIEITERKNAEDALVESEKKFRLLFDTSPDGMVLATLDGKIISANQAFLSMTGYSADEIESVSYFDIVADVDKENDLPILHSSLMFGETVDAIDRVYRRKDGSKLNVQVKGWVIKNEAGVAVQQGAFVKDISFKKKAEKIETSLIEEEKDQLEIELEAKNRELSTKIAQLIEKDGLIATVIKQLEEIIAEKPKNLNEQLKEILAELKQDKTDDLWSQFELTFGQINRSFYENLYKQFPKLSNNEKKICAFLKMNLSTKDISSITHQSSRSIEMARTRLRKKLDLKRSDNLTAFLAQF